MREPTRSFRPPQQISHVIQTRKATEHAGWGRVGWWGGMKREISSFWAPKYSNLHFILK
jgi:hypothetical protein